MMQTKCPCCMTEHDVQIVTVQEDNMYKGEHVGYTAEYSYCERADRMFADERQIVLNWESMRAAYREKTGSRSV